MKPVRTHVRLRVTMRAKIMATGTHVDSHVSDLGLAEDIHLDVGGSVVGLEDFPVEFYADVDINLLKVWWCTVASQRCKPEQQCLSRTHWCSGQLAAEELCLPSAEPLPQTEVDPQTRRSDWRASATTGCVARRATPSVRPQRLSQRRQRERGRPGKRAFRCGRARGRVRRERALGEVSGAT